MDVYRDSGLHKMKSLGAKMVGIDVRRNRPEPSQEPAQPRLVRSAYRGVTDVMRRQWIASYEFSMGGKWTNLKTTQVPLPDGRNTFGSGSER